MKLKRILEGLEFSFPSELSEALLEREIRGISSDSRVSGEGHLFVCRSGGRHDGHYHASEALKNGADVILCDKSKEISVEIPREKLIFTPSTARAESFVWYNYLGAPADGMKKIAVTGTAGKTGVTLTIGHILSCAGEKVGMITTLGAYSGGKKLSLGSNGGSSVTDLFGAMTTPDPEFFFGAVREMREDGCTVLVYEASSQSIERCSTSAIKPDIAVFTNLSEEHLDAHGTMEEYFRVKASLLSGVKKAVVNIDDEYLARLPKLYPNTSYTLVSAYPERVSESDACALRYKSLGCDGIEYVYFSENAVFKMMSNQIGRHSVMNTMEASAAALLLGVDPMIVREAVEGMPQIDGRMKKLKLGADSPTVFIDYAHTPRALEASLCALREITESKLTVVFGCGGDRDRTKRPLMMRAAQKYADLTVVTSDNPRNENPDGIIEDILGGADKTKPYTVIKDRAAAIKYALFHSCKGDTLLLAGKGHERYEITKDGIRPFSEEDIVLESLGISGRQSEY